MMTRDDVLRELELLPVWKLRTPAVVVAEIISEKTPEKIEVVIIAEAPQVAAKEQATLFEITLSNDKNWAFACESGMPAGRMDIGSQACTGMPESSSILFNNIMHALHIEKPSKQQAASVTDIDAKIIVAMGESVAQKLLNTQDSLENLRGKLHTIGNATIIACDDLAHLIASSPHKAKLWQDLCLARAHIESLQSLGLHR